MFGPSGFETKPTGSVISSYVLHAHPFRQLDNGVLLQVKMLIRLEHCVHFQIHGCDVSVNNASIVNTLKVNGASALA
jgi:hypothetical protein